MAKQRFWQKNRDNDRMTKEVEIMTEWQNRDYGRKTEIMIEWQRRQRLGQNGKTEIRAEKQRLG